ncbi:MAG: DnaJ domain-containing protein [Myxococcales bacterium]|nr:DnaJ domain-containing protein [Myxococcales bacterium]
MKSDPYRLLGVAPSASLEEIKRAYRHKVQRLHPDRNPDPAAHERFIAVSEAYRALCDARRAETASDPEEAPGSDDPAPGRDLLLPVSISLREVALGGRVRLQYSRLGVCPGCRGTGRGTRGGCALCRGASVVRDQTTLEVRIPPGVEDDSRIRIDGAGDAGAHGGPAGNLLLSVRVSPHPLLRRDGGRLLLDLPLPAPLAALGGRVRVPTPTGSAELTIPPGTQDGEVLRLAGQGLPRLNGRRRAELQVRVRLETPVRLNAEARALLAQFSQAAGERAFPRYLRYREMLQRTPENQRS